MPLGTFTFYRKALLSQFRKWKARVLQLVESDFRFSILINCFKKIAKFQARNMRKFKIVVTERGRREMAEAEEEKNKKRDKKASA